MLSKKIATASQVHLYPRMLKCLLKEWRHAKSRHEITGASTIFFGGGTPSLMPLRLIETLVKEIAGGMEVNKTDQTDQQNSSNLLQFSASRLQYMI